jgi:uncharacterized alpha/beta hydrolase family protein
MPRNKKIFVIVAVLFIATMIFFTIDIFSRTTRRGAKKHLIESVKPKESPAAASSADSTTNPSPQ